MGDGVVMYTVRRRGWIKVMLPWLQRNRDNGVSATPLGLTERVDRRMDKYFENTPEVVDMAFCIPLALMCLGPVQVFLPMPGWIKVPMFLTWASMTMLFLLLAKISKRKHSKLFTEEHPSLASVVDGNRCLLPHARDVFLMDETLRQSGWSVSDISRAGMMLRIVKENADTEFSFPDKDMLMLKRMLEHAPNLPMLSASRHMALGDGRQHLDGCPIKALSDAGISTRTSTGKSAGAGVAP